MGDKTKEVYVCSSCAFETPKWNGRCGGCGEWNTLISEIRHATPKKSFKNAPTTSNVSTFINIDEIESLDEYRYKTGCNELDRVLGGGIVKGSLVLLGGDPGIGKSTLLLQICEHLGKTLKIMYVSGEESPKQIKLRAIRLGVNGSNLFIVSDTDVYSIINTISVEKPDIVMIDSIQTMSINEISSSAGSVTQVRESTTAFMKTAKSEEIPVFIVGHVNKDGAIAGPKVLEHIVDCVLYFEGERHLSYRILRAVKNRFGSTNEIGVFEMLQSGLDQVDNPSLMLLSGRPKNVPGTCVACVMEGSRPILCEVQALVTTTGFGNPRRMTTGFDYNRTALLLAVLEKRGGYFFGNTDVYVNITGGLKLDEPAADLPVALSLISSLKDIPMSEEIFAFGEIGLAGEIRGVSQAMQRVQEAQRLGFKKVILPKMCSKQIRDTQKLEIELYFASNIREAASFI